MKAKEYEWKDSNMELFGSSTDRQVKSKLVVFPPRPTSLPSLCFSEESAVLEKCWEPVGRAKSPFLMVWRVNVGFGLRG